VIDKLLFFVGDGDYFASDVHENSKLEWCEALRVIL